MHFQLSLFSTLQWAYPDLTRYTVEYLVCLHGHVTMKIKILILVSTECLALSHHAKVKIL
jgi:hypothetical protein